MTAPTQAALLGSRGIFLENQDVGGNVQAEWESLCDGCARCCLEKLEDEDTGKIYFTHVSCKLLDAGLCACKDYANRSEQVPDCVRLTPENVRSLNWLPPSCGYKLVAEGRDLYWWHPLISGDPDTVHEAGVSVRGRVQGTENEIPDADLEDHIVQWPELLPKRARLKKRPQGLSRPRACSIREYSAMDRCSAGRTHAPDLLPRCKFVSLSCSHTDDSSRDLRVAHTDKHTSA